jgi:type I restriction enzyme S subunit
LEQQLALLVTEPEQVKGLRDTILQLAVQGKLVPQDPNDEPASVLLTKIQAEKERLIKAGKIKRQKPLPPITDEEKPFELPKGWEWARWDDIALKIGDIDHKMPEQTKDGIPYISPRDFLPKNGIDFAQAKKIDISDFEKLALKIVPQRGDIIYPRYGTIGENRLIETDIKFLASYSCAVIKVLHGYIDPLYQFIFSVSPLAKNQAKAAENKTTQANVGLKSIQLYLVPLAPYDEQSRIAEKYNLLMSLCDQLEARLQTARQTQAQFALETVNNLSTQ